MKSSLRILTTNLLSISIIGCTTHGRDTFNFQLLDDFSSIEKPCSTDSQCKTLKVDYLSCGHYEYMVYSIKTISGVNEIALKRMAMENLSLIHI